jgi:hypothetical protein
MTAACGGVAPASQPRPNQSSTASTELLLDFEHTEVALGAVVPAVQNIGTHAVRIEIATRAGGRITLTGGAISGHGARLPAFQDPSVTPGAVVVLRTATAEDPFAPGARDFRFGADVALDAISSVDEGGDEGGDDGDNVVQRGHFADQSQYKLQLDHGVPSCRLSGTAGSAQATATASVIRDHWYHLACERVGDHLSLIVEDLEVRSPTVSYRVTARVGDVSPAPASPLSVGGKAADDGSIPTTRPDQLNASIDNVFFELME